MLCLQSESPSSHWCTLSCVQTSRVLHSMGYNSLQVFLPFPPPLLVCVWSLKNTLEAVINQLRRCTKARLSPDAYQTFSLRSNVRLERRHNSPHIPRLHALGKWKGCWQFVFVSAALLRDSTIYIPEELVVSLLRRGPTLFVDPRSPPSGPMRSSHVGASRVTAVHCLPPPSSTRVPSSTAR